MSDPAAATLFLLAAAVLVPQSLKRRCQSCRRRIYSTDPLYPLCRECERIGP